MIIGGAPRAPQPEPEGRPTWEKERTMKFDFEGHSYRIRFQCDPIVVAKEAEIACV